MIIHQHDPEMIAATRRAQVNAERDRRTDAGFMFMGKQYQSAASDRENIMGASFAASIAIAGGAQEGDFRWKRPDVDFKFISTDNSHVLMDAQTTFALGLALFDWKEAHIFAANALKSLEVIPMNFADDSYWPVAIEASPE